MNLSDTRTNTEILWENFSKESSLTPTQLNAFQKYYTLLVEWNKNICNLTTITELSSVITDHFQDSLSLQKSVDLLKINSLADVGTGAGFPGLALKIVFPHIKLFLIEVTQKKRDFLAHVAEELGLLDVTIIDLDWRTFLRSTSYPIDIFCSRAALPPKELIRMLKPSCFYKNKQIIYWASKEWVATPEEISYILKECTYMLDTKKRRLIFFAQP
jgi:16S rRNA (guanine(527)-N(7))-methyltransferase RsmG